MAVLVTVGWCWRDARREMRQAAEPRRREVRKTAENQYAFTVRRVAQ
ncbi:hypothetical protein ABES02_28655 [Neobacillus pocheonensis]